MWRFSLLFCLLLICLPSYTIITIYNGTPRTLNCYQINLISVDPDHWEFKDQKIIKRAKNKSFMNNLNGAAIYCDCSAGLIQPSVIQHQCQPLNVKANSCSYLSQLTSWHCRYVGNGKFEPEPLSSPDPLEQG